MGENLDPGSLDARDLLGLDPAVALRWTGAERAAAREVLEEALAAQIAEPRVAARWVSAPDLGEAVGSTFLLLDEDRQKRDADPPLRAALVAGGTDAELAIAGPGSLAVAPARDLTPAAPRGWEAWGGLAGRGSGFLVETALLLGHPEGELVTIVPAPQAPLVAVYVPAERALVVNPVVLAAFEPEPDVGAAAAVGKAPSGNPYSFYGSVAECASAQRLRCDACLPGQSCVAESRDVSDGNEECRRLTDAGARGAYQYCANLSLAIANVAACVADRAGGCEMVTTAGNQLSALSANDRFLDDATCRDALDLCLAEIFGAPSTEFPPPPPGDAGPEPPPPPPPVERDISVDCGECNPDLSCNFDPQCSTSCDSNCQGSDGCSGGTCSGGDCESPSCDTGSCSSSSGGGGGGCSSSSSGGGGGCSGSGCSGGGCDSGGCSGGSCSSSSNCQTAPSPPRRGGPALPLTIAWLLAPLFVLERWRRRARNEVRS